MNIILSGGWGYGNLGDDALLEASLFILREKYPNSNIIVLSYDKKAVNFINKYENVLIKEDLYKSIFISADDRFNKKRLSSLLNVGIIKHVVGAFKMFRLRFRIRDYIKNINKFQKKYSREFEYLAKIFDKADLYVMSGGGYLNDWVECSIIKHQECCVAQSKGVKILMIGQTIGPFQKISQTKKIVHLICQMAARGFFRDTQSILEFNSSKFLDSCIPDLALYMNYTTNNKLKKITLIGSFSFLNAAFFDDLCKYCVDNNYYIEILTTQLWESAMIGAVENYIVFRNKHCPCTIVLPNNYDELNKALIHSAITISQNLHGLILSYRAGAKVISLSAGRKYISFMDLIGNSNAIINYSTYKYGELVDIINNYNDCNDIRGNFKNIIDNAFSEILD